MSIELPLPTGEYKRGDGSLEDVSTKAWDLHRASRLSLDSEEAHAQKRVIRGGLLLRAKQCWSAISLGCGCAQSCERRTNHQQLALLHGIRLEGLIDS